MTVEIENVELKSTSIISHLTGPEDNLFTDLGFPAEYARQLQSEADAVIDQKIARATFVSE